LAKVGNENPRMRISAKAAVLGTDAKFFFKCVLKKWPDRVSMDSEGRCWENKWDCFCQESG